MHIIAPYLACALDLSDQPVNGVSPLEQAIAEGYTQIYVPTPDGYFKFHLLQPGAGGKRRFVCLPVKEVPGVTFSKMEAAVQFLPDGKIPMELFETVKDFFSQVIIKKGQKLEAMIWILWNETDGYFLHVPDQTVGPASATYDWGCLPAGSRLIVDIHSHADFGAFFSGTDDRDDLNSVRFSGVVGYNNRPVREMKFRFNYFGAKMEVNLDALFEHKVSLTPAPEDWFEKIKTSSTTYHGYSGHTGYTGYTGHQGYNPNSYARRGVAGMDTPHQKSGATYVPDNSGFGLSGPVHGVARVGKSVAPVVYAGSGHPSDNDENQDDTAQGGAASKKKLTKKEKHERRMADRNRNRNRHAQLQQDLLTQTSESSGENEGEGSFTDRSFSSGAVVQVGDGSLIGGVDVHSDEFAAMYPHSPEFVKDLRRAALNSRPNDGDPSLQEQELNEQAEMHLGRIASEQGQDSLSGIHPEFDEIAINHGVDVARAFATVDLLSGELVQAPELLKRTVVDMFQLVDDDSKLRVFRQMADTLSNKAKESLATNGL